jgi:hypothetical protein
MNLEFISIDELKSMDSKQLFDYLNFIVNNKDLYIGGSCNRLEYYSIRDAIILQLNKHLEENKLSIDLMLEIYNNPLDEFGSSMFKNNLLLSNNTPLEFIESIWESLENMKNAVIMYHRTTLEFCGKHYEDFLKYPYWDMQESKDTHNYSLEDIYKDFRSIYDNPIRYLKSDLYLYRNIAIKVILEKNT